MEKRAHIFSWMGSVFVVCILFAAVFASGKKAEAALAVKEINYENSTITITTTSGDTTLYFSDKRKTKWEMAAEQFQNNECTMDISWVSMTQNYELTFKGDKTNKSEDILSVIIPKQEKGFKAKYDLKSKEVVFTGAEDRTIEYRKNNTDIWEKFNAADMSEMMDQLCENGASVYFRLEGKTGDASSTGYRPSKEVACKIPKKSAAPTVTIDASNATIAVQSGWQWRKVGITEKNGVQYVTSKGTWETYPAAREVPLSEMAEEAVYPANGGVVETRQDTYLQFRKSATSSTQVSYITTIKVPAQEAAPNTTDSGISIEYTSTSSFKLTISAASPTKQYEYCIVDAQDMTGDTIADPESITWKAISSATGTEIKKAEAPQDSVIFYRKKAVGKTGDDNFRLATPYTKAGKINYNGLGTSGINQDLYTFDGICVTSNSSGNMLFQYNSPFNTKITSIGLSTTPSPSAAGDCTVNFKSTVAANTSADVTDSTKYIVTTTITNITLSSFIKEKLKTAGADGLTLYAYIQFASGDPVSSDDENGLRIHMKPKSEIDHNVSGEDNAITVTRFIGATGSNALESFWFKLTPGSEYGRPLGKYCNNENTNMAIESVYLGNYQLSLNKDYQYASDTFTVNLNQFEKEDSLIPYYGTTQSLVIKFTNGEKLTDVSIKLVEPVSLNDTYAWAFTKSQLISKRIVTKTDENGITITEEVPVHSYSVGYTKSSESAPISVSRCIFKSATLGGVNIIANTETDKIVFSNELLKQESVTGGDVVITFSITYSNNTSADYVIKKGCHFTIIN